ncbi:membrane protein [Thermococcus guaymasensis DSM 11113]|uniref:Membrane protein n=1 Tax=Thermococcus guaymasensis DSM 11113 TaxID=1432656 RepID=A0A0X1KIQ5_9EURY|nr:membrane protein [Thermococcus guaymasensis DSM 11113]
MRADNKFALAVYLWGAITGIISGALSVQNKAAWIIGALMFLLSDVFIKAVLRGDFPEELKALDGGALRVAILKKAFWGWLLFWLYFTMLVYTIGIDFKPVPYNNQSLLAQMMNSS